MSSDRAVVPFPSACCPVCGRPVTADHPVPPQVHSGQSAPRLPDGLASVLARTGQVSRTARAHRAAEEARIAELAAYLLEQVALFRDAMHAAGAPPSAEVRTGSDRGRLGRGGLTAWAVRHWRAVAVVVGDVPRTRHLYVVDDGTLYESPIDPGVANANDSAPVVERVDLAGLLLAMGEVDALRTVERVISGLADVMKEAGASL